MPRIVKSIVLTGNGTNCEREMAHACRLAGSDEVDIVYIHDILSGEKRLDDYHFLILPGGFLDGDDLGAAQAGANRIIHARVKGSGEPLRDQFRRFIDGGKLILGVCNGFQLMVKLGILPAVDGEYFRQTVTLTFNDSGRFEDRWVWISINEKSPCVFTRGLKKVYLPVRHGEGKFMARSAAILKRLHRQQQVVARYCTQDSDRPAMTYPDNPNGAVDAIAGICNETGRLYGMMPHPDAYTHRTNHPRWTREELPEEGMGLAFFKNAVQFIRSGEFEQKPVRAAEAG
ncbi:MAG: phosphoribosylformylglycinamidine synthase subunit PurQ [Pseudomonadota bacterium]|nr:phosphoribosylformylglycinamidine synthase subunit PurQ [Syntrophaceae bacterium]MDI9556554.1 phosphoribosylformylglycinamidine synthase subunit PurQ [Pseudomonadota bacterium]NLX31981.1 phosphoribosylformylglycinamidine synthase subunit PurQ [Deltaproteobacteria bacterium]HNU85709.1 phosphoribosylformylglycinamidine synthase subunit PurQ [Syntrophales bacterium]HNZ34853.1 phosphoribosylformylglycinamidine synthase subunit PurQ [Syntrophales bacterium]